MRLSQRAWNNVIIFAMLAMILLFNLSDIFKGSDYDAQSIRPLLPRDAVIMTIDYGDWKIERIGQGWRRTPAGPENVALSDIITQWQAATLQSARTDIVMPDSLPVVVVVWLAGEGQGRVFEFYPLPTTTLIRHANAWYELLTPKFEQLINA